MRAEVGEVLEVVEGEHGPALCALYGEEAARRCGRALERDEPLDRRQQACHFPGGKFEVCTFDYFFIRGRWKRAYPICPRVYARPR